MTLEAQDLCAKVTAAFVSSNTTGYHLGEVENMEKRIKILEFQQHGSTIATAW